MARRRPKDIGTAAETAVTRWLQTNGWPHAERRALRGSNDAGDITGTPGLCWEVKAGQAGIGASDIQIDAWLSETRTQRDRAGADYGILIQRRRGKANPGNWWAWIYLGELIHLTNILDDADDAFDQLDAPLLGYLPCRMRLADLTEVLHRAGYGNPE